VVIKHDIACSSFPGQLETRFAGGGGHDLYLVNIPLPHVLEHVLHAPHSSQSVITIEYKRYV
jgi:acetoin utilization deacetylase AcuC-like enzyme